MLYYKLKYFLFIYFKVKQNYKMGIGDWGLGIGDWGLGPIPNPPTPIPNPHPQTKFLKNKKYFKKLFNKFNKNDFTQ